MAINVTVSGNPIRINRGKMVTSYDPSKIEFDKRRLIRLEQVRQQSKDIAETLRNKLKKEKENCLSEIEKDGETKLKNWQNRKLLELQNQYQEALDEIGLTASSIEDEDNIVIQQEINEEKAKERGRLAQQKLQIQKNEENLKKAVPRQRKIVSTDLEITRANNVSKKGKKTPKKAKKLEYDSDCENRIPPLNLEQLDSDLDSFHPPSGIITKTVYEKEQQTEVPGISKSDKEAQTNPPIKMSSPQSIYKGIDTRISERIKRRTKLTPDVDFCNFLENSVKGNFCTCQECPKHKPETQPESCSVKPQTRPIIPETHPVLVETSPEKLNDLHEVVKNPKTSQLSFTNDEKTQTSNPNKPDVTNQNSQVSESKAKKSVKKKNDSVVLPKVKVTLRSSKKRPVYIDSTVAPPTVEFYDHPNRFTKFIRDKSEINKIDDKDIIISPTILSDDEILENMRRRDKEAHLRGQLALEKDRIQREYRDLLRKLPALQKQERILEIGSDKEKYHMSRDRLEDLEKRRQNRLDNAYEELFVRTQPITIPKQKPNLTDVPSLNLANWDTDFEDKNRSDKLTAMLIDLKSQKESLLKEIENTLSKDEIKSKSTDYTRIKKRKRDERPLSPTTSDIGEMNPATTIKKKSGPSPRKKIKKTKILQNISTQTTPKTDTQSAATSPIVVESKDGATVCPCIKNNDMCEIVIKIKDDDKPEVEVNPPFLGKSVKVISESVDSKKSTPSWKEQLSENSSLSKSTSTSYLDPPNSSRLSQKSKTLNTTTSSADKQLDPRLLTYIKKLLNMSRGSIDNLTVSSVSDVSTPSHSLMEMPSNNPVHQLRNIMKYFNIDAAELQKQLSCVSDGSSKHYNSSESVTITPSSGSDLEKTEYKSCTEINKENTLQQYADIAKSCTDKINNLTAMIAKVRAEKKKIIDSSSSGSDLATTTYKDLPDKINKPEDKLLKIDYNYAKQLKNLSKEEIEKESEKFNKDKLFGRLKELLENPQNEIKQKPVEEEKQPIVEDKQPIVIINGTKSVETTKDGVTIGVSEQRTKATIQQSKIDPPLFLDIPKLPRLEAPSLDKKKKRPPASKLLLTPHELSTIIEADSQLSAKVDSPQKSKVPDIIAEVKSSSDDISEIETMESMLLSIGMEWAIPTLKKTREALAMTSSSSGSGSGEISLREFLSKISENSSKSGGSLISETQAGISIIQIDNRKTSTPIINDSKQEVIKFGSESDVSSVREASEEKFYDLNEGSTLTKSRD